jgi:hypothetical protein
LDDACDNGNSFDCLSHFNRARTEQSYELDIESCVEDESPGVACECFSTSLMYTCSTVAAACQWDEENEECVIANGNGSQLAPRYCEVDCDE